MSVLQRQSHAQADDPLHRLAHHISHGLEDGTGRYEPQALTAHSVPTDPYTAWVAQREAACERDDRTPIRWVYRYGQR
jgi:hypothetical protein